MAMSEDSSGHGGPVNSAVLEAFEPYMNAIADRIAARLLKGREPMVSQSQSELGPRRHRLAVKRRMQNGEGGAGISPDGRRYLLTPEAVREELARGPRPAPDASPKPSDAPAQKTRARDLSDFERKVMSGLRAVKE
jgi:hypothetical protein